MLTLRADAWFGWLMLPGYLAPYFSVVCVHRVTPLKSGSGLLRLAYVDPGYAEGVQAFEHVLRIVRRTTTHLVAALPDDPERSIVVAGLTREWLRLCRMEPNSNTEQEGLGAHLTRLFPGARPRPP